MKEQEIEQLKIQLMYARQMIKHEANRADHYESIARTAVNDAEIINKRLEKLIKGRKKGMKVKVWS